MTESDPKPTMWQRSTTRRVLVWLVRWKTVKVLFFPLAGLVVLLVLAYLEENWRGRYVWEKYKRQREAQGDNFEWSAVVPATVPDDQNFATTPLFAELFPKPPGPQRLDAFKLPSCEKAAGNWHEGRTEDLGAWRSCFTNNDLLAALSRFDPVLQEIGEASRRPYSRFPIRYEENRAVMVPHLSALRNLARIYRLRALVELTAGQSDAALADVRTGLRMADAVKNEPLLLSMVLRVALLDLATQPVWEGLAAHRWNDSQLVLVQSEFEKINPLDHLVLAIQGERRADYGSIRWLRDDPRRLVSGIGFSDESRASRLRCLAYGIPSGWFYQNELRIDRFYTEIILPTIDAEHQRVDPKIEQVVDDVLIRTGVNPRTVLFRMLIPAVHFVIRKAALSHAGVQQAVVACALERYRLKNGQLPEKLDSLVPEFLVRVPHDVIDGQPLRYRRTGGDQFILYSVGWNETDDGGQPAIDRSIGFGHLDQAKGDWVWFSQPQPQPSASERK